MGRPPSYDMITAVQAATDLFRAHGFHGARVQDLITATGMNRTAIYEKFGSKEDLFYAAMDYYHQCPIRRDLLGPFWKDDVSLDSLVEMLETLRRLNQDQNVPAGCLIISAGVEFAGRDERVNAAVHTVMLSFAETASRALRAAEQRGDLARDRPLGQRVEHVVVMVQAFFTVAHISRQMADRLIAVLLDDVESWRDPRTTRLVAVS